MKYSCLSSKRQSFPLSVCMRLYLTRDRLDAPHVYSAAEVVSGASVTTGVAVAAGDVGSGICVVMGLSALLSEGMVAAGTVADGVMTSLD